MRITFRLDAQPNERYTEQFAQSLIGQTPRLNIRPYEGGPVLADYGTATVVAAEIIEDGAAVLITYETSDKARYLVDAAAAGYVERLAGVVERTGGPGMSFRPIPAEPAPNPYGLNVIESDALPPDTIALVSPWKGHPDDPAKPPIEKRAAIIRLDQPDPDQP